jgi:hypothetical protein
MDNATYLYNIGPIFVRNQTLELDDNKNPITIENISEFNENMISDVFQLSSGDTLILGAYGLYKPSDDFNEYSPVRYRLNLINNSTQSLDRVLFEDTISAEDSVEIQFLRGYVINELPYSDSFYVQIEVNPDDGGDGDGFGIGGGYDPPSGGEGDNSSSVPGMKGFFENDFTPIKNTVVPDKFALNQNYPNPFNPVTTISFDPPKESRTNLIVYDITGREIARLVNNELKQAGKYNVTFNAINLASGIYFYRIQADDFVKTKRMVLVK